MNAPVIWGDWALLRPWWLLAWPILGGVWALAQSRGAGPWAMIIDPRLLAGLKELGLFHTKRSARQWLGARNARLVAAGVLALALSGPAVLHHDRAEYRAQDPLILSIDMSPSVVGDQKTLTALRTAAAETAALAGARPIGVMLYSAEPYLALVPTTDLRAVSELLSVLSDQTMPLPGSKPEMALSMLPDFFAQSVVGADGRLGADVVVVSDGGGIGPRANDEARRLASQGFRIWGLGVNRTAQGAPEADLIGLAALAQAGGGASFAADQPMALIEALGRERRLRLAVTDAHAAGWRDLGYLLLVATMAIGLFMFRRRG